MLKMVPRAPIMSFKKNCRTKLVSKMVPWVPTLFFFKKVGTQDGTLGANSIFFLKKLWNKVGAHDGANFVHYIIRGNFSGVSFNSSL